MMAMCITMKEAIKISSSHSMKTRRRMEADCEVKSQSIRIRVILDYLENFATRHAKEVGKISDGEKCRLEVSKTKGRSDDQSAKMV
jgi:hypothetical protein